MSENAKDPAGDLAADVAALRQDIGRLAETVSRLVQHQMADAQENVCATRDGIAACIEHRPMTAVLVAFGIGTLIGMMHRSR
jgi:ElaB/YqjD/DUF883 family membrane-anchored ribosome-binding protein